VLLPSIVLEQRPRNEFLARFRREADAIAALDHVNIMPVYEYGEQGDIAYLVMPYVTGGTLRDILEKRSVLTLEEVLPIIEQAAAALDTAHAQSIVHRDLKPGNMLFHADGRLLLADFGLAKVLSDVTDQESSNGHLTSAGTIVGTPEYLSPEQGTGDKIDYRTDVYSLGVVLYQMLAGRVPFTGTSPVAVAIKHALEEPPQLRQFNPSVPKSVETVVMKAMAKKPDARYNSAGAFALALRQAVAEELGEQFLRVEPTPSSALPPVGEKRTPAAHESNTKEDDAKTTVAKTIPEPPQPGDQLPSMSTVMMESEIDQALEQRSEAQPRLAELTKNRIPALPTMITDTNDQTIADYPRSIPPTGQPQPVVAPTPVLQQQQPVRLRQEAPLAAPPFVQQPAQPAKPKLLPLIGVIVALLIVISGIITMLTIRNDSNKGNGSGPQTATTRTVPHSTTTPTGQQQTSGAPSTLPAPMSVVGSVGSLLYGTNYPANCDGQNKWSKQDSIQVTCNKGDVQITNTGSSNTSGVFLNNVQTGSSYYIQVQATVISGKFTLYFSQTSQGVHNLTINLASNIMDANYTRSTSPLLDGFSFPRPIQNTNTITVGLQVSGNSFTMFINNLPEGTGRTDFSTSGGVGIGVDPGSIVSFKNFEVYESQ
jgi:serine/threonine protein kinase